MSYLILPHCFQPFVLLFYILYPVPETWKNSGESDSQERKEAADTQERNTSKTSNRQDGRTDDTQERETTHLQVRLTSDALNRLTVDSQERETGEAHEETHSIGIPEEDSNRDKYNTAADTDMRTSVTDYAEGADHVMTMDSEEKETFKSPMRNHLSLFLSRQSAPTTEQVSLHTVRMHKVCACIRQGERDTERERGGIERKREVLG